jgi:pyridoxal phosphate enzyme (YggS family)
MKKTIERLDSVQKRINQACLDADRVVDAVTLLAVSKRHSAAEVTMLNSLGVISFGENQLQEALDKQDELSDLKLEWHFIGAVQSNKTRAIAKNFQWVQSVDRIKILRRLSEQRPELLAPLNICLQVNINHEEQKAGASPTDILNLAEIASNLKNIRLRGLMAIPRLTTDLKEQHDSFRKVRLLFQELNNKGHNLDTLSMGMSADMGVAIAEGSTMVRIGTDLFGKREI